MAISLQNPREKKQPTEEPIHGISLAQYASLSYYLAGETRQEVIFSKVGIDKTIWNEIDRAWRKRMEEDDSFILITRYSQFYNEAEKYINIKD